ncbi:MAG TPA: polymer-forming cytoskeletal protein [Myxococcaceae bacterium]|nr:polymer-forming cytoskeletal protein [Myxococcaceae bacterium]
MATLKEGAITAAGGNTVIGQSILISGKLAGDEDLTVRGRVEGELTLSRTLIVEMSGVVKANVAVKNAIVSGVVVGNINATESVELTREGRMVGDIRAPRVIIVDGASFRGHVDMGEVEPGRVNAERPARPVLRPAVRPSAPPPRPSLPARTEARTETRPAAAETRTETRGTDRPRVDLKGALSAMGRPPAPPPAPPVMAQAAKKKVSIKPKKR